MSQAVARRYTLPFAQAKANAHSRQDLTSATQVAYQMVTMHGMSDVLGNMDFASSYEQLSSETKLKIEQEVIRIVEEGKSRATALLTEKRKELDMLAKALVEYETLSRPEVAKVLKGEKLDKMTTVLRTPLKLPEIVLPPGMGGESSSPPSARDVDQGPDNGRGNGGGVGGARL